MPAARKARQTRADDRWTALQRPMPKRWTREPANDNGAPGLTAREREREVLRMLDLAKP